MRKGHWARSSNYIQATFSGLLQLRLPKPLAHSARSKDLEKEVQCPIILHPALPAQEIQGQP